MRVLGIKGGVKVDERKKEFLEREVQFCAHGAALPHCGYESQLLDIAYVR